MLTGEVPVQGRDPGRRRDEARQRDRARRPEPRPDASAVCRRGRAGDRKDPRDRYRDMNEFLADLEHALEVEVARAGGATGEATSVLDSVPTAAEGADRAAGSHGPASCCSSPRRRALSSPPLTGSRGTAEAGGGESGGAGDRRSPSQAQPTSIRRATARSTATRPGLRSTAAPPTAWSTETTPARGRAGKHGVGLYVDAGRPVTPSRSSCERPGRLGSRDLRVGPGEPAGSDRRLAGS